MKTLLTTYCLGVSWLFGYLTAFFGLPIALGSAVVLCIPCAIAWRISSENNGWNRIGRVFVLVTFLFATAGVAFSIRENYRAGVHHRCALRRAVAALQGTLRKDPRFLGVHLVVVNNKGLELHVRGSVATDDDKLALHDFLYHHGVREGAHFRPECGYAFVRESDILVQKMR